MSQAQLSNDTYSSYARLLGKENFKVDFSRSSTTAYFDVKNRKLVFPVWEVPHDVMVLLSSHEVGHAIYTHWSLLEHFYTNYSEREKKIIASVFNVVEDARIEKLMKRRYPGISISHRKGYSHLFKQNFFGKRGELADRINTRHFLDRANLYFKVGINGAAQELPAIKFTPQEAGFIEAMKDAESFQDALDITAKIYDQIMDKPQDMSETQTQSTQGTQGDDGEAAEDDAGANDAGEMKAEPEEGESGESADESEKQDASGEESEEEDSDQASSGGASSEEGEETKEGTQTSGSSGTEDDDEEDEEANDFTETGESDDQIAPEYDNTISDYDIDENAGGNTNTWDTQDQLEENLEKKTEAKSDGHRAKSKKMVVIPTKQRFSKNTEIHGMVPPHMITLRYPGRYKEMISSVRKSATHMANEFAIRKSAHNRKMTRKTRTGQLDSKNLSQYKFSEDMFRQRKTKPKQTNHGMVIIVDCSISMRDALVKMAEQIALCVEFAKKTNVKVEVWGFTTPFDTKKNAKLYQITSSETKNLEKDLARFTQAIREGEYAVRLGYTPLAMSMLPMADVAEDFKSRHKIEKFSTIVLTDGGDNSMMQLPNFRGLSFNGELYDERTKTLINCDLGQVEGMFRFYKNRVGGKFIHIFLGRNTKDPRFSVPTDEVKKEGQVRIHVPANERFNTVVDKMFSISLGKVSTGIEDVSEPENMDPKELTKMMSKGSKAPKIFLDELVEMIS